MSVTVPLSPCLVVLPIDRAEKTERDPLVLFVCQASTFPTKGGKEGEISNYGLTQFEATDARRAFVSLISPYSCSLSFPPPLTDYDSFVRRDSLVSMSPIARPLILSRSSREWVRLRLVT